MAAQLPNVILALETPLWLAELIKGGSKSQAFLDHQRWRPVRNIRIEMEKKDTKEQNILKALSFLDKILWFRFV